MNFPGQAQTEDHREPDTNFIHKGRLTGVLAAQGTLYAASLAGLYFAWYQNYPQTTFHFYNDHNEWLQMDKCGHMVASHYISRIAYSSYRWAGLNENQASWYGGLLGFAYLLNIEILDGFSSEWGFSPTDLAANTLGSILFISQQLAWHTQRFSLKYSAHQTKYAQYRPDLLGNNLIQNMLKDYNGQSYWISGNISSFLPEESKFPKWLNVAVGYGAEGMTGGYANPSAWNSQPIPDFTRYRQFFLSLDVDLTRIPTRSRVLKGIFNMISFIKIPSPTVEFNTLGEIKLHAFYF